MFPLTPKTNHVTRRSPGVDERQEPMAVSTSTALHAHCTPQQETNYPTKLDGDSVTTKDNLFNAEPT